MAPNLAASQHELTQGLIESSSLTDREKSRVVGCSERTIRRHRSNIRCFGSTKAPPGRRGRPRCVTPPMLKALCDRLVEKPTLYLDEMADFIWDRFEEAVTTSSIRRALVDAGWSRKVARRVAKERNADLRDYYLHQLTEFESHHLVYVDESGCDTRAGIRRTGWSPLGVPPIQVARFQRGQRYQILPAYAQDGVVYSQVFQGSTDSDVFEDFIGALLPHCGRWPEPKSVLVMDNASFHHSGRVREMCAAAGVKLLYLPPYSPDFNPIEEFFSELKRFVKRHWQNRRDCQDFGDFLQWCVDTVGSRRDSARGHFRHSGISIDEQEA